MVVQRCDAMRGRPANGGIALGSLGDKVVFDLLGSVLGSEVQWNGNRVSGNLYRVHRERCCTY
jgi:hypothetical protein